GFSAPWAVRPPPALRATPAPRPRPRVRGCYAGVMRRVPLLLTAALLPGALAGCSSYQPPVFEAVGVRETERTPEHAVIVFTVRATNPNREPMPLRRADYEVFLAGEPVFTGVRSPETTVNTYGTHEFDLPAVVPAEL